MDTVSMLNTMSFYCQPILPLVYDESMSYYETLCKVVGQLNTTGETVNKLNEGLIGEISERQTADAALDASIKQVNVALDARIKQLEETNRKMHFLKLDTLGHLLTPDLTREKLSQWVQDGDLIVMLYAPGELENSWAVATSYRCLGATGADTMQLNFYVPISIVHNAGKSGSDVAQEVVVISLPTGALTNQWVVRSITTTIPDTNADGFVNLTATVSDSGAVTCDVEPGAIVEALRNYFSGTNQYAVAVNARLNYDGKQYHSSAATVKADAPGAGNVRIAFENYWDGVRAENGVRQTTNTTVFLVGDVKNNAWSVETIDHKTFDFSRYEGFQFTRGANNVITTNDESTPNAVYAQYHSDTSGKLYQNLPTRLIDSVDSAEYWNGTFDIYGGNHMTFTFVTSNYATSSDKMLVRVIELSADVGTTAWKYGVKEFTLPLSGAGAVTYVDFWGAGQGEVYEKDLKAWTIALATNQTFDAIYDLISSGADVVARLYKDSTKAELVAKSIEAQLSGDKTLGNINFLFVHAASDVFLGFSTIADAIWVTKTANSTSAYALYKWCALPVPAGDSTDNGKVPTVDGTSWALKTPSSGGSGEAVLYTAQTLTDEQKKRARDNIDALRVNTVTRFYDANFHEVDIFELAENDDFGFIKAQSDEFSTPAFVMFGETERGYRPAFIMDSIGRMFRTTLNLSNEARPVLQEISLLRLNSDDKFEQQTMATAPTSDMQIATKKYVDDSVAEAGGSDNAVLYTEQTLTSPQQIQARKNINAAGTDSPQFKGYVTLTPATEIEGVGVGLSPSKDGNNFALDISDVNESAPTKLTGVKTPTDADTNAAATVEYVKAKVAGASSGTVDTAMSDTSTNAVQNKVVKKYVDDNRNQMTNGKLFGTTVFGADASKPNLGVQLEVEAASSDAAINLLNLYGGEGTKLTGIATPGYADNDSAATVAFVLHNSFVIVDAEEVKNYDYQEILEEINRGTCNIWLDVNQQKIRINSYKVTGSGAYQLIFIGSSDGSAIDVHSVTVSASAAEYAISTK